LVGRGLEEGKKNESGGDHGRKLPGCDGGGGPTRPTASQRVKSKKISREEKKLRGKKKATGNKI